jgi:tetratricopeptide (TPR) repeat protein/tRNA A-37 threonylcarbamoyl transferase component Bud32
LHGTPYKKGDFIGQKYEVYDVLGKGGFGIVYLVYSHETESVLALKTFRDEYLEDGATRQRFRKEAQVWVDLERHPYLVRAHFLDEINGRLYIGMEHIAPDEQGLNTLEGYLRRRPPNLAQSLRWSVQFCHGMEYAYSRGIRAHRDIKPANIMIGQDRTVKISDFGLAGVLPTSRAFSGSKLNVEQDRFGLSGQTIEGTGFGTPEYMPPEQFVNAAGCDQRSDVYSFGVTLYQMVSRGRLPFTAPERTFNAWYEAHIESVVPDTGSPLSSVIRRCLEKEPGRRYATFSALRAELEPLLKSLTGEVIKLPELMALEVWELYNKGVSLSCLGLHEEAVRCYDSALRIVPQFADAWSSRGAALHSLGRDEEALPCYDRALAIDPRHTGAWGNKGSSLLELGRYEKALACFDQLLRIDSQDSRAWNNRGCTVATQGRHDEAIRCFDRALELDPESTNAWENKGLSLLALDRYEEAIRCLDTSLEIDPRFVAAWSDKAVCLNCLSMHEEAIRCCHQALEIDSGYALAWCNIALAEEQLGRQQDAVRSYRQFLALASAQYAGQVEYARKRLQELEGK